ncbi:MAG: carboxypeptidase-like regulatory domain-containing protein [Saprospiraceae bacterium]|nr:carboxypeptidase-like regulatory domain-containing protein [Saprospiraceae bacterium]
MSTGCVSAQYTLSGSVIDLNTGDGVQNTEVYNQQIDRVVITDKNGYFEFKNLGPGTYDITIFTFEYSTKTITVDLKEDTSIEFDLEPLTQELSAVEIVARKAEFFDIRRLRPVEGTAIYAGKKSEVILLDQAVAGVASNTSRQIYAQVVGLNIYESNDAGLQLSIGGRGLDPNRTANFNTRQNGYDISADVLGYPESYYTPPAEALNEIQVIRGAASLQYGTQFGGLINFKLKKPVRDKKIELVSRQTLGSFGLFTSFNSLSGTHKNVSYYTYFNYKKGDGYRENSNFDSKNFYGYINYKINDKLNVSLEATYLKYLAKQAGGLTDPLFNSNSRLSTRDRNWFEVDWRLISTTLNYKVSEKSEFNLTLFGLDAQRNSVGFRGNPINLNGNPVIEIDEQANDGSYLLPRDLLKGTFKNGGAEARFLSKYKIGSRDAVFLVGAKIYKSNNTSLQGAGTNDIDADFSFANDQFPDYANQSEFTFPNFNASLFGEHIFYLGEKLTLTPGFRLEYINTESEGTYSQINFDIAGNPISNQQLTDNRSLDRTFMLAGIGASYKFQRNSELYANISQNYRSVTFSDIRVVSPTFIIDPNIQDEKGFTGDFGWRGRWKKYVSFDLGGFALRYSNRIGLILDDRANRVRKNIGTAFIYGLETFANWNIAETMTNNPLLKLNLFVNSAITGSEYIASDENNVKGNNVEFIPKINLKSGIKAGYKNMLFSIQYSYLSKQFTDAENSLVPDAADNRNGVIGEIPSYGVMDFSSAYSFKRFTLESGILNILDTSYFTRRATGYPGPGIIPSDGRSFYLTLGIRI